MALTKVTTSIVARFGALGAPTRQPVVSITMSTSRNAARAQIPATAADCGVIRQLPFRQNSRNPSRYHANLQGGVRNPACVPGRTGAGWPLGLDDLDRLPRLDGAGHRLASTRKPPDFDPRSMVSVREAEVERQVALREVARLSVEELQNATPVG